MNAAWAIHDPAAQGTLRPAPDQPPMSDRTWPKWKLSWRISYTGMPHATPPLLPRQSWQIIRTLTFRHGSTRIYWNGGRHLASNATMQPFAIEDIHTHDDD